MGKFCYPHLASLKFRPEKLAHGSNIETKRVLGHSSQASHLNVMWISESISLSLSFSLSLSLVRTRTHPHTHTSQTIICQGLTGEHV